MNGFRTLGAAVSGLALALTSLAPQAVSADVVHLRNGRTMEGVVLEETRQQVLLQLPFGEVGLPRASILRIERGRSPLEEYLDRRQELERRTGRPSEWLDLALWAKLEGLDHSAREATLVAARLDPGQPGLTPLMTAMGYEYEENLAVWLPYDELMRRRGYIQSNGRWLSPDQAAALERDRAAAAVSELHRQRQDRLARAMEMMVLAQMAQAEESRRVREEAEVYRGGIPLWGGYPVVISPGYWPRPPHYAEPHHPGHRRSRDRYRDAIVRRPPGSLIPVTPAKSHHGSAQKPSGSD